MFNSVSNVALSMPRINLVSQGYVIFNDDTKLFVRVFHDALMCQYIVKIKLPEHCDLHINWKCKLFFFEYDQLVCKVLAAEWRSAKYFISQALDNVYVVHNDPSTFKPKHW